MILFFALLFLSTPGWTQPTDTTAVEEVKVEDDDSYDDEPDDKTDEDGYFQKKSADGTPVVVIRTVPKDRVKEMKDDKAFWYADHVFEKKKVENESIPEYVPLGQRRWFQVLLWLTIIVCFAIFLVLYLTNNNVGLFRKKDRTIEEEEKEQMETGDIFAINFQKEIEKAAAQGNFRLAIRLMYLRLLKELSEKNIINYTQDKTNFDYLLQLHPTRYYKDFFRITRHYEYSWYGQFDVSEDAYKVIRHDMDQFERESRKP